MLRAEFSLPSITAEEASPEKKAPIRVKFEIPYFTVSGIQVSFSLDLYLLIPITCHKLNILLFFFYPPFSLVLTLFHTFPWSTLSSIHYSN